MKRVFVILLALAGLSVGAFAANAAVEESRAKRMRPAAYLPDNARRALRTEMHLHGQHATDLIGAILVLDYPTAANLADRIAGHAILERPFSGEASVLDELLPNELFLQQRQMVLQAQKVAELARKKKGKELVRAYGKLSQMCVACHLTYLDE